ncbi:MAG TPA: hypothetical protein VHX38_15145 [Pseudonocardiaceae bacterium]|jgi:hypothetical protein|nr:hypothetical protein [Pseudonocardiaceae bacterium]
MNGLERCPECQQISLKRSEVEMPGGQTLWICATMPNDQTCGGRFVQFGDGPRVKQG